MYYRLFLFSALLCCYTGEASVPGPPTTVLALAGGDVILPCRFDITAQNEFPAVEWSKHGLQPDVVFLFRDGCETLEMKNPAFLYRTSFVTKERKNGNISLRISDVQLSDAGTYQCMTLWGKEHRDITAVELVVGAASEPKLWLVSAESGWATLQCDAVCWQPEPRVDFVDANGNQLAADDPKRQLEDSGCYSVTRRVTLQSGSNRVTCRVHQPEINQTRDKDIVIPVACMKSFILLPLAVGGTVALLSALCGLIYFVWKRHAKSEGERNTSMSRQSSGESTLSTSSVSYENHPLLGVRIDRFDLVDNVQPAAVAKMTREVAELKSELHEKNETIRQLKSNNLPKNQGPKSVPSRQNPAQCPPFRRNQSSPALLNINIIAASSSSSGNPTKKKLGQIGRSMSYDLPVRKAPKLHRRHSSSGLQTSVSNNRRHLMELREELEPLTP